MMRDVRAVVPILILILSACGYGDRGFDVTLHNDTAVAVVVVALGVVNDPTIEYRLAPGQALAKTWRYPRGSADLRRIQVEARADGTRIFCETYSYDDLKKEDYRIRIRQGVDACT